MEDNLSHQHCVAASDDPNWERRGLGRLMPAPLCLRHQPGGRAARTGMAVSQKVKCNRAFCTTLPVPVLCNSAAGENRQCYSQGGLKWERDVLPMQQDSKLCPLRIYPIYVKKCKLHQTPHWEELK